MSEGNPFPDSSQKAHVRRADLQHLARLKESLGRPLAYFGLPSAQMLDVRLWKPVLRHVTAVERDPDVALALYRTAQLVGMRQSTLVLEMQLADAARLLAMTEQDAAPHLSGFVRAEQEKIQKARSIPYEVFNLDLYRGFLYERSGGPPENAEIIRHIVTHQSRYRSPFLLIATLEVRDTGKESYIDFISGSIQQLLAIGVDARPLSEFYLSGAKRSTQPPHLRRMRFCFPVFAQKLAFDSFHVRGLGSWYYKSYYHVVLLFEPRQGRSTLGLTWPPLDEFKELISMRLVKVESDLVMTELYTPELA